MFGTTLAACAAAILAGCASQPPAGPPGKHLVYRDGSGTVTRQFDYPSEETCKRVESMAGRQARCQLDSASSTMQAKATLRYNPPGMVVEGHYADLARCRADTGALPPGVQLINGCATK